MNRMNNVSVTMYYFKKIIHVVNFFIVNEHHKVLKNKSYNAMLKLKCKGTKNSYLMTTAL